MSKKIKGKIKKSPPRKNKRKLSKKDLAEYKEKLLNLRDDVLKQMRDISEDTLMKSQKESSGDISGYSLHMADAATDSYERDFNIGLVSSERKIIMEIDEALKKVEERTYGICEMCGEPISKVRLTAIPYAKYSKKCQEKLENQKESL